MKRIYDGLRSRWVSLSSEERVRQLWLHRMVSQLEFPKGLLVVERELHSLPHLSQQFPHLPSRRIDILSFAKRKEGSDELFPLLLVECKSNPISNSDFNQVFSYNLFIKAPYVALVNQTEVQFFYITKGEFHQLNYLPSFHSLMETLGC